MYSDSICHLAGSLEFIGKGTSDRLAVQYIALLYLLYV